MLISITGPSSSGKTTLINKLKIILPEIYSQYKFEFIDEQFREYIREHNINVEDIFNDSDTAFLFEVTLLDDYSQPDNQADYIIMDRSPIDNLVYMTLHYYQLSNEDQNRYAILLDEAKKKCKDVMKNIKVYMCLPDNKEIQQDDERPTIYEVLRQDEIFLFKNLQYEVLPQDLNGRIDKIINDIREGIKQ